MLVADMIVEFSADTARFEEGVGRVDSSMQSLASAADDTSAAIDGKLGSSLTSTKFNLLDFASKAGSAILGFKTMATSALDLAGSLLEPNASMEQLQVAFTQLLHGSKAAQEELARLSQFAAVTPFQMPELADADQKLLAFQFTTQQTLPLLTAIGDALSGLGKADAAHLDQVVNVFGQMKASGKLATQDLMQLTSVGINGFQILADGMHKTVPEIKAMVTAGLIPADQGIELLRQGMEKTFGGGMQAQSQTFNGLLSTFKDNIERAWLAFSGPLFDAAKSGLVVLGNIVSGPQFQQFATTMGQDVATALTKIGQVTTNTTRPALNSLSSELDSLGKAIQGPPLTSFRSGLNAIGDSVTQHLLPALGKLADNNLPHLGLSFDGVGARINTFVAGSLFNLGLGMQEAAQHITTFSDQLANVHAAATLADQIQAINAQIARLQQVLSTNPTQNLQADLRGASGVLSQVTPVLDRLQAALRPLNPQLEAFGRVALLLGGGALLGVAGGFTSLHKGLQAIGENPALKRVVDLFGQLKTYFDTSILPALADAEPGFKRLADTLDGPFATSLKHVLDDFIELGVVILGGGNVGNAGGALPALIRLAGGLANDVAPEVKNFGDTLQTAADRFTSFAETITKKFREMDKSGRDWSALWISIKTHVGLAWDGIQGIFLIALDTIEGALTLWIDIITGNWKGFWHDLYQTGSNISDDMINMVQRMLNRIGDVIGIKMPDIKHDLIWPFHDAVDQIQNEIQGLINQLLNLPNTISSNVGNITNSILHNIGIPGYASGTDYASGGLSVVGENGPELLNLPRGAQVIPLSGRAPQFGASTSGGNQTIILEFDSMQMAQHTGRYQDGIVRLKLGPRGRTA